MNKFTSGNCRIPHFIIIGACKSGTTTLYDDLARHPDSVMPLNKEPDILHRAGGDADEARRLWNAHFPPSSDRGVRGEGSTYYTMVPDFADVASLARDAAGPGLRLVYIMRDPVARIESHLAHDYAVGRISSSDFDRIVLEHSRYLDWSNYALQLRPWISAFGKGNLLPVIMEDFVADRDRVARKVACFVGLDPDRLPAACGVSNVRGSQRVTRSRLIARFQRSNLYQTHVRPLVPSPIHRVLRQKMTATAAVPKVKLAAQTVAEVRSRLATLEEDLEALGVPSGRWFLNDA